MVDDPVFQLIEYTKSILYSPDCLRSVVLFFLASLSVTNMAFVGNFWYESYMGGVAFDVYHMLCTIILSLSVWMTAMVFTFPLMELTWNHAKMGLPPLLTDFLNRLIFLFCLYLSLGYLLSTFGLFGEILPAVLFYGVTLILLQRLFQVQLAKSEVSQIQSAYDRLRRQRHEQ